MSSSKRASLSSNSPLDQLFRPAQEREAEAAAEAAVPQAPAAGEPAAGKPAATEAQSQGAPAAAAVASSAPAVDDTEPELRQTTIMIYDHQADWLDEVSYLARRENGSIVSKAAILRALVDMAREEEDVRRRLREKLGLERER